MDDYINGKQVKNRNLCSLISRCSLVMESSSSPVSVSPAPTRVICNSFLTCAVTGTSHPELAEIIARRYPRQPSILAHGPHVDPTGSVSPSPEPR